MNVPISARVECRDGSVGESVCVIVDPNSFRLTHVVVRERRFPHREWLVPADRILATDAAQIRLDCAIADLDDLEEFTATEFVNVDAANSLEPGGLGEGLLWPYTTGTTLLVRRERIPAGETVVRPRASVDATDGPVGHVDELIVDAADDQITDVVVRQGHWWNPRELTIPASEVSTLADEDVQLSVNRRTVDGLPAVPVRRRRADARHAVALHSAMGLMATAPHDVEVAERVPDSGHLEGARLLADEAADVLRSRGFSDEQIREWAETYVAHEPSGDLDGFFAWMRDRQAARR